MSFTGVDSLDRSIAKVNTWMADIDKEFGTETVSLHTVLSGPGCTDCGIVSR